MELRKYIWVLRAIVYKLYFYKVGKLSYIGKPISIIGAKGIHIGQKVRIYPGARLECYDGGEIIIDDNVAIGQNVHITCAKEKIRIRTGTVITGNCFITNICHEYEDVNKSPMEEHYFVRTTSIGKNCFIGYGAGLLPGGVLGDHCVVGAHSLVNKEFECNSVVTGNPAVLLKYYDKDSNKWIKKSK